MNINDILAVATNLTESEFESFCKGASIYFMSKGLKERDQQRKSRLIKQMRFFDSAFDKYKSNCISEA